MTDEISKMLLCDLDVMIKTYCPIHGINTNGEIWFKDDATEEQKEKARQLMAANIENVSRE